MNFLHQVLSAFAKCNRLMSAPSVLLVLAGSSHGAVALAQPGPSAAQPQARCAPAKLTRMVVRDISPGVSAADPRAQPRTMFRLGDMQLRSEEQPDLGRGGETRLVIISEPDIWTIDLSRGRGAHSIDPGPELFVRSPILPEQADIPSVFRTLEFGCEADFVATHVPKAALSGAWGTSKVEVRTLNDGEHSLSFMMDIRRQTPVIITYSRAGKVGFAVRYDAYRNDQPENPALFAPPKSVQITETAPAASNP